MPAITETEEVEIELEIATEKLNLILQYMQSNPYYKSIPDGATETEKVKYILADEIFNYISTVIA